MNITDSILKNNEKSLLALRNLYQNYGYIQFKMNKFEEYDLYVKNKDFLISDNIITFTDTNGKLMALKPDVTLSIIKNLKEETDLIQKVYYSENVYRVSKNTNTYKELMQTGLECIGKIDLYNVCEVILLAYKSLKAISNNSVLVLSHIGIISVLLDSLQLDSDEKKIVYKYISEKNIHGIEKILKQSHAKNELYEKLIILISTYGSIDEVLKKLKTISINKEMDKFILELENIYELLKLNNSENIQIDFSIINGMNYYNGIVFQGFIEGIPSAVLSGGRYDKLLAKMGKQSSGIGFAVYLNLLEYLFYPQSPYDIDILLLYDKNTDVKTLTKTVKELTSTGKNVQVQKSISEKIKYRQLLKLEDGRLITLERND